MNRRTFLGALAAVPAAGLLTPVDDEITRLWTARALEMTGDLEAAVFGRGSALHVGQFLDLEHADGTVEQLRITHVV